SVGSAVTNGSGVATLSNVSLNGFNAGTAANAVGAAYTAVGGTDPSFQAATPQTGGLTVDKKNLDVTASSHAVTYGDSAPTITHAYDGTDFVGSDSGTDIDTAPSCS